MKNQVICFSINTFEQAKKVIQESKKINTKPVLFISYYIISGFGIEWLRSLQLLLKKIIFKNSYKFYVDANYDYGLSIDLIKLKVDYIKLKSNPLILNKINQIAKKNKVLLNPSFRIVDLSNIKNIEKKIQKFINKEKNED